MKFVILKCTDDILQAPTPPPAPPTKSRTQAKESTTTTTFQKPASGKDIKKTATVLDYLDHYHLAKSKRRSSQNKSALLALWYVFTYLLNSLFSDIQIPYKMITMVKT